VRAGAVHSGPLLVQTVVAGAGEAGWVDLGRKGFVRGDGVRADVDAGAGDGVAVVVAVAVASLVEVEARRGRDSSATDSAVGREQGERGSVVPSRIAKLMTKQRRRLEAHAGPSAGSGLSIHESRWRAISSASPSKVTSHLHSPVQRHPPVCHCHWPLPVRGR
jgi:hypothetical protein